MSRFFLDNSKVSVTMLHTLLVVYTILTVIVITVLIYTTVIFFQNCNSKCTSSIPPRNHDHQVAL